MKKLLAISALALSAPAFGMGCEFVTDPANDAGVAGWDLQAIHLDSDGDNLTAVITVGADAASTQGVFIDLFLRAENGVQFLMEVDTVIGIGAPLSTTDNGYIGTWTEDGGTYSPDYAEGSWPVVYEGSSMSLTVPLSALGSPSGEVSGFAAVVAGIAFTDTTDEGRYTIGENCARRNQLKEGREAALRADGRYFSSGGGSFGGGLLMATALLALRRRRRN